MTITHPTTDHALTSPRAGEPTEARAAANMYGAFSLEHFCDQGGLTYTHDDAQGFLAYVEQFTPRNFWYQDANVRVWAYYETFDDYQNTYGMDAVRVPYHSGHGGMDANGVFYAPMGSAWQGNDCTATSTNMRLGNEEARYLFWSTCSSLRTTGGHSPIRTWGAANLGMRMIFGFDTTSWDNPNYGKNFWKHWRNNETFASAWLNASWDIAHDQSPSVAACGATLAEANAVMRGERTFNAARANTAWWTWSSYNAAASVAREPNRTVPDHPRVALLAPVSARTLAMAAEQFDIDPTAITATGPGAAAAGNGDRQVFIGESGLLTAHLGEVNYDTTDVLERPRAVGIGGDVIRRFGLDADSPLILDRVVDVVQAGGSADGTEHVAPRTVETVVQYRQFVDDTPFITPDAGVVRISIDNEGTVTRIQSTTRTIDDMTDRPRRTTVHPNPPGSNGRGPRLSDGNDPEAVLAEAFGDRLRSMVARGSAPVGYSEVPGTREVGFGVRDDADSSGTAELIARQAMELEFEEGYRKRIWVTAPLSR